MPGRFRCGRLSIIFLFSRLAYVKRLASSVALLLLYLRGAISYAQAAAIRVCDTFYRFNIIEPKIVFLRLA